MLKETMTYTDYDGVERKEDFYFNFTPAEISEMELTTPGGMADLLKRITDAKDQKRIVEIFKEILLKAYGVKSADGRRFIKSKELSEEFSQTEAYSDLFMRLATDTDAAIKFVNAIIPQKKNADTPTQPQLGLV